MRRIKIGQRLIHQQYLGLHRQRTGQQHPLALAARQLHHRAMAPLPGLGLAQAALHNGMVFMAGRRQPGLVRQPAQQGHIQYRQVFSHHLTLAQPSQGLGARFAGPRLERLA